MSHYIVQNARAVMAGIVVLIFFVSPVILFAQGNQKLGTQGFSSDRSVVSDTAGRGTTFGDIVESLVGTINLAIPIVVGVATLTFFWGIAKFVLAAGDETAIKEGKQFMLWGIVALFIMFSIFGIINLLASDVGGELGIPKL